MITVGSFNPPKHYVTINGDDKLTPATLCIGVVPVEGAPPHRCTTYWFRCFSDGCIDFITIDEDDVTRDRQCAVNPG